VTLLITCIIIVMMSVNEADDNADDSKVLICGAL